MTVIAQSRSSVIFLHVSSVGDGPCVSQGPPGVTTAAWSLQRLFAAVSVKSVRQVQQAARERLVCSVQRLRLGVLRAACCARDGISYLCT